MPLTAKGEEILANLKKEYGAKKGEQVLYAGKNKGTFTGIDSAKSEHEIRAEIDALHRLADANPCDEAAQASIASQISALSWAVDAMCDAVKDVGARMDAYCDDHRVTGGVQITPTEAQIRNELGLRFDKAHGIR